MDDLTGFQRDLLYVIAGGEQQSGQDIKEEIEQDYDIEINHGRLYPNLDTLVNKDLVEKGELDRRTNYYEITATGETAIQERREWGVSLRRFVESNLVVVSILDEATLSQLRSNRLVNSSIACLDQARECCFRFLSKLIVVIDLGIGWNVGCLFYSKSVTHMSLLNRLTPEPSTFLR